MSQSSKGNVLVTGGAGFIGAHVAEQLKLRGYTVLVLDDLSGGFAENIPADIRFVEGSILDNKLLSDLFKECKFNYVFHLAAYAAEGLSHFIKRFNYMNNVVGSVNLINEAVKNRVKCFIFTSSIAVYGTNQLPMREDLTPNPEDSYGIAKYAVELELKVSKEIFGLDYVIFRPHNVYGEKQNIADKYRNVVGIFMNNILQGLPIQIFGDGSQTRAFSHIDDVAPIIVESIANKRCCGETFNVGADQYFSVNHLADVVEKVMGKKVAREYIEARNEVLHAYADHGKVQEFFGERKLISLEEGILRMAQWVKEVGARKSKGYDKIEIFQKLPAVWRERIEEFPGQTSDVG